MNNGFFPTDRNADPWVSAKLRSELTEIRKRKKSLRQKRKLEREESMIAIKQMLKPKQ